MLQRKQLNSAAGQRQQSNLVPSLCTSALPRSSNACRPMPISVIPVARLGMSTLHKSETCVSTRAAMIDRPLTADPNSKATRPLEVVIAGGGIGGLVLAVALLKKGVDVTVYERDLSAIRGEGKYRGPIQVRAP